MTFRVLGPLALTRGDDSIVLPPSKVTCMLATLLVHPNEVVDTSHLQNAIWGDDQPLAAKAALQTCAMRLRKLFGRHGLGTSSIETVPGGYRFVASGETLDLVRFRELAAAADGESRPDRRLELLDVALRLWSGPMLANVPSEWLHRDIVPRLDEERLDVLRRLCELKIDQGMAAATVAQLWDATRRRPGDESLAELHIEALYRTGRQSDALAEYHRIKSFLSDELGLDPGPRLKKAELSILNGEPRPEVGQEPAATAVPEVQPVSTFVGRDSAAAEIAGRLSRDTGPVVLTGMSGIGKTALARHIAATFREHFPGGQRALGMRAADGSARVLAEIVGELASWRTRTDGRRGLLILDDVVGVQQALAVVSAAAATRDAVLVTSQHGLSGVMARFGGRIVRVSGLARDESVRLLAALLGPDRVNADPAAADELADVCGDLPLALQIAAARIQTRDTGLAEFVAWLRESPTSRLSLPGDPDMTLTARFERVVSRLSPVLADAVRRLAGAEADIDGQAAVGLLRSVPESAEHLLDQLADASLVEERGGRYRVPHLIRSYLRGMHDERQPAPQVGVVLSTPGMETP